MPTYFDGSAGSWNIHYISHLPILSNIALPHLKEDIWKVNVKRYVYIFFYYHFIFWVHLLKSSELFPTRFLKQLLLKILPCGNTIFFKIINDNKVNNALWRCIFVSKATSVSWTADTLAPSTFIIYAYIFGELVSTLLQWFN